jgi:hypothetical protein
MSLGGSLPQLPQEICCPVDASAPICWWGTENLTAAEGKSIKIACVPDNT